MLGIGRREERKLLRRLKRRLKELYTTPMYEGRRGIDTIHIDDLMVEIVLNYCNIDKVLKKIKEVRNDDQHNR